MSEEKMEFDLQPDPRILPMLGEINLAQWQCIAELIDNAVDGFMATKRNKKLIAKVEPKIQINLPTSEVPNARVTIVDTGPGMSVDILEQAVRAGWSGNSPIDNLGLFGMGFNIATARLGSVTTVWTTREEDDEWHGLKVDFDKLREQRHFKTPHLTRPKGEPGTHGTEVTIERLKPDQRAWLSKPANQSRVRKELSRVYASMLRPEGVPISFELKVNRTRVLPLNHCVWDENRVVETARWGTVPAVIQVDRQLPKRRFCLTCWQWLTADEQSCPACESSDHVIGRKRHVHGWIGLQRYLSTSEYGIDFIRNGRKIETLNKDLFEWRTEDTIEREYPIDDPRNRGRFVGEIHLDHCRVHYTKDRFERTDPAWEEMVRIVRGEGPLRPEKAAEYGYAPSGSPLFRLFQAFRRSSPTNARVAGGWAKVLVVKDHERAEEMAKQFNKGIPEYQDDGKWWELVEEEDNKLLTKESGGSTRTGDEGDLAGFGGATDEESTVEEEDVGEATPPPPSRSSIPSLSREYLHERTGLRWDVQAFEVEPTDPGLGADDAPWRMIRQTSGEDILLLNPTHSIFQSATMTNLDALMCELTWSAVDILRNQPELPSFACVLADLRDRYAGTLKLDTATLKSQAEMRLAEIASAWTTHVDADDCASLFTEELSESTRDAIYKKMAARSVTNPQETITAGRFLEYAPRQTLLTFFIDHPELFFDGRCWDDTYSDLDFGSTAATDDAQSRLIRRYESLLIDAIWLAEQEPTDLEYAPREQLMRAVLALDLLTPIPEDESAGNE
ncbi:MAG: ATP-binding protein [Candidatus Thiodiazotropha sp. (ex Dulcina madagascariensis)]|nr:ATP-binding protein [Candidatus Thiodiazotropha sp. (ex Dulcina madagascariensis)]